MIRRSLNERFAEAVLGGIKVTTIRDKAWPIGKPIMLFRWEGKAYRSKQVEIAPVVVNEINEIKITRGEDGGMIYAGKAVLRSIYWIGTNLHLSEGFGSQDDMDAWFRPLVKPGQTITKSLMRFRLLTETEIHQLP